MARPRVPESPGDLFLPAVLLPAVTDALELRCARRKCLIEYIRLTQSEAIIHPIAGFNQFGRRLCGHFPCLFVGLRPHGHPALIRLPVAEESTYKSRP